MLSIHILTLTSSENIDNRADLITMYREGKGLSEKDMDSFFIDDISIHSTGLAEEEQYHSSRLYSTFLISMN